MNAQLLGRVLVDAGLVGPDQLDRAIEVQKARGTRLGQILVEMGAIDEESLAVGLAQQVGFKLVDPKTAVREPHLLSMLPQEMATQLQALPLGHSAPGVIQVALSNPFDMDARRDIEFALGVAIEPVVAYAGALREAISKYYGLERELEAMLESVQPAASVQVSPAMDIDIEDIQDRLRAGGAKPYIELLNYLLAKAFSLDASDVHLEPQENHLRIRYRIDGVLREAMKLPKWVEAGVLTRIKVVGEMDLSMHRRAQDGSVRIVISGREMDLRISVVPSQFGENVVLRILDPAILDLDLSDLGFATPQLQDYYQMVTQPRGMIISTGPTGAGKSTTLYATIKRLRSEQTSIVTVEDPIEYTLPGITQMQVDHKHGMGFAASIRSLLRQDPNVMIIGEIRDPETASTAFQAALTGHLVFSTLHTGDALSTITRLRDLQVPLYLLGSALLGVVAQRLVRRLCPHCRQPTEFTEADWDKLHMEPRDLSQAYRPGAGCRRCLYTGYRGRVGVYEILRVDDNLRGHIFEGADETTLRQAAADGGLRTLLNEGVAKVDAGITSLEEVSRHLIDLWVPRSSKKPAVSTPAAQPAVQTAMPGDASQAAKMPLPIHDEASRAAETAKHLSGVTPVEKNVEFGLDVAPADSAAVTKMEAASASLRAAARVDGAAAGSEAWAEEVTAPPQFPAKSAPQATEPRVVVPDRPEPVPRSAPPAEPDGVDELPSGAYMAVPETPSQGDEKILVVDDSEEILEMVRFTLSGVGYRVATAKNGQEALDHIDQTAITDPVHLVVLDVMMPGMNGFEVCQRLKEDISSAFLPVLILSARGEQSHIREGFRSGADDYLSKPFDPEELELRIRALLKRAYR